MPVPIFLFLLFLTLKLTSFIDWSWWWVTSPLWIITIVSIFWMMFVWWKAGQMEKEFRDSSARFGRW